MQYIADAREAKEIDSYSIQEIGIPSMVLMEKAAMAVAEFVKKKCSSNDSILVICGTGNNGGDGVASARLLWTEGYAVTICLVGSQKELSDQMEQQIKIARKLGMKIITGLPDEEYTVILDALFGVGLSRDVIGDFEGAINWINEQSSIKFSVDIPSGISASTGEVLSVAVYADYTITFGLNKRGLVLFPGCNYAGKVSVADIGIPQIAVSKCLPRTYTLTRSEAIEMMPQRILRSNKGTYGKVLVIAGSREMSGAAVLCASAAYRMGCGMVKVFTAKENELVIKTRLPEALVSVYDTDVDYEVKENADALCEKIQQEIDWATAIVIGPGIGLDIVAQLLIDQVIQEKNKAIVIDADGLNLLAKKEECFVLRDDGSRKICLPENIVLTPHLKEMTRLVNVDLPVMRTKIVDQALVSLEKENCQTLVLKDSRTIVTDGSEVYVNTTGNNALATAGSGDVLSGMICSLMAQGLKPKKAAVLGVCLHGIAAEEYVEKYGGRYSMIASDIIDMLPHILPK